MNVVDSFIEVMGDFKDHCTQCLNLETGSNDHKRVFKQMRDEKGCVFHMYEKGKEYCSMFCPVCNQVRPHRRLEQLNRKDSNPRSLSFSPLIRKRVLKIYCGKDAFDGTVLHPHLGTEIDHRVPENRRQSIHIGLFKPLITTSDDELREHLMLLSRSNNTRKREACRTCIKLSKRPPSRDGISYWYLGGEDYIQEIGCEGCFWAYPEKWRSGINATTKI
jgi:hypothetical protein